MLMCCCFFYSFLALHVETPPNISPKRGSLITTTKVEARGTAARGGGAFGGDAVPALDK